MITPTFKKIFVVAGHGGKNPENGWFDPGAVAKDGTTERSIIERVCGEIQKKVKSDKVEFIALDEPLTLSDRTKKINEICKKEGLDYTDSLLISIHVDYSQAQSGVYGYYYGGSQDSQTVCESIAKKLSDDTSRYYRGCYPDTSSKYGRLGIVRDTQPLAILIEIGSLCDTDLPYLKHETGVEEISSSLSKMIRFYLNLPMGEYPEEERWWREPLAWMQKHGIVGNEFKDADKPITKREAIALQYRAIEAMKKDFLSKS